MEHYFIVLFPESVGTDKVYTQSVPGNPFGIRFYGQLAALKLALLQRLACHACLAHLTYSGLQPDEGTVLAQRQFQTCHARME